MVILSFFKMSRGGPSAPIIFLLFLLPVLAGCGGSDPMASSAYGDRVVAYQPMNTTGADATTWSYFFDSSLSLGPPGGTFDVVSLGYDPAQVGALGGFLVLGVGMADGTTCCIYDGMGVDLVVYENVFATTDAITNISGTNNEAVVVEVSADGMTWYAFPPAINPALHAIEPAAYDNLAGITPTDEGGDGFDLGELIALHNLPADFQACLVRLSDGGTLWADYGNTQSDFYASGADIDAIEAIHHQPISGGMM